MLWVVQESLDEDGGISKGILCFRLGTNSSWFRTTRIPRPPPPMAALMMTGKPTSLTNPAASSYFSMAPSVPGTVGTPALSANSRALTLSPSPSMVSGRGPMKAMPASSTAFANSGFSDRKPYPGLRERAREIRNQRRRDSLWEHLLDHVDAVVQSSLYNLWDIEVGLNWVEALSNLVGLVCFVSMRRHAILEAEKR
jgi:hypothetical protein